MTIATKNGAVILKNGAAAENCNCCDTTCRGVVRSVRVKVTSPPQIANDVVDSGTSMVFAQSYISPQDAIKQAIDLANAHRGTYRTQAPPSLDWVTLLPSDDTTCGPCAYTFATNDISLQMQNGFVSKFYSEWTVVLDVCNTTPREVAVVGYKIPMRLVREFPIAEFSPSDSRFYAFSSQPYYATSDARLFDSMGGCNVGNTVPLLAYTAAGGGGGNASSGSVDYLLGGVVESVNPLLRIAQPYASGALSYQIAGSVNGGTTWTIIPGLYGTGPSVGGYSDWDYAPVNPDNRSARCSKVIALSQACGFTVEVAVA